MKTTIMQYLLGAAGMLACTGCSEDKGNYEYTTLNEVTIEGIDNLIPISVGTRLQITPTVTSADEASADLSYSWTIDGTEYSTERNLDIELPALNFGLHTCYYTVTDNTCGMKYRQRFEINITSSINLGYFFLTGKEDLSTELAYIPAIKDVEPTVDDMQYTQSSGSLNFGNDPQKLLGSFGSDGQGNYLWTITVLTREGQHPTVITNTQNFTPTADINTQSFVDTEAGYTFLPEDYFTTPRQEGFFISEGKVIKFVEGFLYRPAKHKQEYYWSWPSASELGADYIWVYDQLSHKCYGIQPQPSDPMAGITGDEYAFDQVLEAEDNPTLAGTVIGLSASQRRGDNFYDLITYCTAAPDGIHFYHFEKTYGTDHIAHKAAEDVLLPTTLADENTQAASLNNTDWYFSFGNAIYTTPVLLPKLSAWTTVPEELGQITTIGFSAIGSRMVVTTYNPDSPEERKGSVLFIDVQTRQMTHVFKNCIHKCVSFLGANAETGGYIGNITPMGDGK